jgi:phage replication-related protein YjqB (UPF0714/DUF867 family)
MSGDLTEQSRFPVRWVAREPNAERTSEYPNFAALSRVEREGEDFRIVSRSRRSQVAVIAPHGGKIEAGTSEIAAAIAGDEFNLYCFEGCKPGGNIGLHITSANFDEPNCLALISSCDRVVTVHGCRKGKRTVFIGGRDARLRDAIRKRLEACDFRTAWPPNSDLQGVSPRNICNKGRGGCGAQLDLSRDLRDELGRDSEKLAVFAAAVRAGLAT